MAASPIIQVLAREEGGWRVCVTYLQGVGVHAWQRRAETVAEVRKFLDEAVKVRARFLGNSEAENAKSAR